MLDNYQYPEGRATEFAWNIGAGLRLDLSDHFAMVLESFLDYLDAGQWPRWLIPAIRMRYSLLARAREFALR